MQPAAEAAQESASAAGSFGRVIQSIEFKCAQPVDRRHFDPILGLRPGDTLTRTTLKSAIQALYDTGRFSQIAAETAPQGPGVQLNFKLELNLYFNRFTVLGSADLGGRTPAEVLALPVGQRFTTGKLETARLALVDYLRERGFHRAQVTTETRSDEVLRQVDTTFVVQSGSRAKIRSVTVVGVPPAEERNVRDKFSARTGQDYRRDRITRGLEDLKAYLVRRGFLGAEPKLTESFDAAGDTVDLILQIRGFGRVRVVVEGFDIPRDRLSRLLPAVSGEGLQPELLDEGTRNLREYLEDQGYPEAGVTINDERDPGGAGVVRYRIEGGNKVTVSEIRFRGNRAFTSKQLAGVVRIRQSGFLQKSFYSISKLDTDIRALRTHYQASGYLNAAIIPLVEAEDKGRKLRLTFECEEGPIARTHAVSFAGNRTLASDDLQGKINLRPGGPFSPQIAENGRTALRSAYASEGFLQARVASRITGPDDNMSYAVEYQIEEGPRTYVDKILVLGQERTLAPIIQRNIRLKSNEPLSSAKMFETEQDLYNLGIFDLVRVALQNPESSGGYQNVVVRLAEGQQFVVRYGFGYQEREKVRGLFEISNMNFLGTARRADLRLRVSAVEQAVVLSFQRARISFLPVNSYLSASYSHEEEVSFDSYRANLSYQYSHPTSRHSWLIGRANYRYVQINNYEGSQEDIEREDEPRNLTTLSAIYVNDTRDNYFDAERGFFTSTDFGVTPELLGTDSYFSFYTQNSYHRRLLPFLHSSAALRLGYLRPYGASTQVPISERFFAGGPSSLRGFRTDEAGPLNPDSGKPDGGNVLIIASAEVRAPLYRALHVAGFYDGGNVFRDFASISGSTFSHTVGIGLRIKTPIGPLRFDYAFNLNLSDEYRTLPEEPYPSRLFFFTFGNPF